MDVLTALNSAANYSKTQLQLILSAWVLSGLVEGKKKIQLDNGHVPEGDYSKDSIYSLLYALYRSVGEHAFAGTSYEMTFNTWGYDWPDAWGDNPVSKADPQRFGKHAYAGLYHFAPVKERVRELNGKPHIVEMGCGTGAGAHLVCSELLPECTYDAVDMQAAAIQTCNRKFVPQLSGRLRAVWANATKLEIADSTADIVAVNETHVTELTGQCTKEDQAFFSTAFRLLKPGGFLVWGNAIPQPTWKPCFDYLESAGMKKVEESDVTKEAVRARDLDQPRVDDFVEHCISTFHGFRIPVLGARRRREAESAMKNFYRNPGTNLYSNMTDGTDTYKVVCFQKAMA